MARLLSVIGEEIRGDWKNVTPYAKPYLNAMRGLTDMTSTYGCESAKGIVLYFLCNANSWRGETARRVKAELKSMVGG
jgi:CRISPR/Cas system-associated exonuclease Cas4 (RecB family)